MSTQPVRAPRAPAARTSWRPRLEVVASPAPARSLVPYLLACAGVLAAALLGVLVLNTQMAATAYEIHDQQVALNRLAETEATLRNAVEEAGSPAALQHSAEELGMVRTEGTRFILLDGARILGAEEEG